MPPTRPCRGGSGPSAPRPRTQQRAPAGHRAPRGTGEGWRRGRRRSARAWRSPLGDVEAAGELDLADGLGVAELVEPEFLERLGALGRQAVLRAGACLDLLAELGEFGSC